MWYNQNMMNKLTSVNPLVYPFALSTLAYGVGFTVFRDTSAVKASSLFEAMHSISPLLTHFWGIACIVVVALALYTILKDRRTWGKANCFAGALLWFFASFVYVLVGGWLTLFSVAIPSLLFWAIEYHELR